MVRGHKDYRTEEIGTSKYGSLILAGGKENKNDVQQIMQLHFGLGSTYRAYVVDADARIKEPYKKIKSFFKWLKIYDDNGLVKEYKAAKIIVYRAKKMGCIIQLIK